jgi:4-oxalocrotonate tautomerase
MPHVVVKLLSGRSEVQKQGIADEVTRAVMKTALCGEGAVSVAIEDVEPGDWDEKVFGPEIAAKADTLYKKPGYKAV